MSSPLAALVGIVVGLFVGLSKGQLSPMTFLWPILVTVLLIVPRADLVIEDRFPLHAGGGALRAWPRLRGGNRVLLASDDRVEKAARTVFALIELDVGD